MSYRISNFKPHTTVGYYLQEKIKGEWETLFSGKATLEEAQRLLGVEREGHGGEVERRVIKRTITVEIEVV